MGLGLIERRENYRGDLNIQADGPGSGPACYWAGPKDALSSA